MKKVLLLFLFIALEATTEAQPNKDSSAMKTASLKSSKTKAVAKPKPIVLPVPEYINQPFYYDRSDNKLIKLENSIANLSTKKKTLGLKGEKQLLHLDNSTSKVRFIAKNNISFIIKTSGDVIDLTSYIKLYKFSIENESRQVVLSSKEGLINNKEESTGKFVSLSIKPVAKDNYMIQLPENLEAGEYGFVWLKNMDQKEYTVYTFGIDWKNSD